MQPSFSKSDQVQYRSPNDGRDVVGEIEVVYMENGIPMYGIFHPLFGYETITEDRIHYKIDN